MITEVLNHFVNFGWEYVWHCHILAHEEMDMMHSLVFAVPPKAPTGLAATLAGTTNNPRVDLSWTDNSIKEAQFTVQRATNSAFTSGLTQFIVGGTMLTTNLVTFQDSSPAKNTQYWYRVVANGPPVGDQFTAGFPTIKDVNSFSNTVSILTGTAPLPPAAPSNLTATPQAGPQVSLTWRDNATNETGFVIERCTVVPPATTCSNFAQIATPGPRNNTGNVTYLDATVAFGNSYVYQVNAFNAGGSSAWVTMLNPVVLPAIPPAPTNFTVAAAKANGNNYTATLNWASAVNPTSFTVQRATNATFTTGLATSTVTPGTVRTATQTVTKNTVYYYRIRANNSSGGSSAWTNALPFPIRTGP